MKNLLLILLFFNNFTFASEIIIPVKCQIFNLTNGHTNNDVLQYENMRVELSKFHIAALGVCENIYGKSFFPMSKIYRTEHKNCLYKEYKIGNSEEYKRGEPLKLKFIQEQLAISQKEKCPQYWSSKYIPITQLNRDSIPGDIEMLYAKIWNIINHLKSELKNITVNHAKILNKLKSSKEIISKKILHDISKSSNGHVKIIAIEKLKNNNKDRSFVISVSINSKWWDIILGYKNKKLYISDVESG